jgi:hypothetical protein
MPPGPAPPAPPPDRFDSLIISACPEIFEEFRGKRFWLRWRGSRDGFRASEFHLRCDGHGNTLTVVLDTEGNVFGGFTPVTWKLQNPETSARPRIPADDGRDRSFLFTVKNPHNIPARRFALKSEGQAHAIFCVPGVGPCFGWDFRVCDDCNRTRGNYTTIGRGYVNDTGWEPELVFTGSRHFTVKETEVFEVTE